MNEPRERGSGHDDRLPPRGTRPRNRRDLILSAASQLFYKRGYEEVSVSDLANAVNITPAAIYRHFSGKPEVLDAVVTAAVDVHNTALDATTGEALDSTLRLMAATAVNHRSVGVLLQRESRHLPEQAQRVIRAKVRAGVHAFALRVGHARPDLTPEDAELLASCAIDAMVSLSFHRLELPRADLESLIVEISSRILSVHPAAADAADPGRPAEAQSLRRDALISSALRLFAAHGFTAVSIEDIGVSVGIAGPSVYNYFASKQELLMAALDQANIELVTSMRAAWSASDDAEESLRMVTASYVDMALDHSDQISALITESRHLGRADRDTLRRAQHDFIGQWTGQLRRARPDESTISARIKVQTAQMVANDMGRTYRLHAVPGFRSTVHDICWTIQA